MLLKIKCTSVIPELYFVKWYRTLFIKANREFVNIFLAVIGKPILIYLLCRISRHAFLLQLIPLQQAKHISVSLLPTASLGCLNTLCVTNDLHIYKK
jgi:hypothetical protein